MGCFCSKDSSTSPAIRVDNDLGLVSGAGRYSEQVPGRKPRYDDRHTSSEHASDDSTTGDNPPEEYAGLPGPIPNAKDRQPCPVRIRPRPRQSTLWSVRWSSVKGGKEAAQKRGSLDDPDA
ncbi:hypothetical protein N0V84_009979 [Fusarium piperis]|uniref:Uncharacterized protein n=1 Tax=Fusarium piperis TaxID=1435070 RepID=A0A9W8W584_9HYPO|nr:hypothetical protein N0V84_009979 [Fusarium piperis]